MITRQAIPTDFMGIRFRSKSEAMFANLLEHANYRWAYEPSFLSIGDYTPDFLALSRGGNTITANIVEYKPGKPTKAYFEKLASRRNELFAKLGNFPRSLSVMSINFFEECRLTCWSYSGSWRIVEHGFTQQEIDFAKNYRYDLEHNQEILCEQDARDSYKRAKEAVGIELSPLDQWKASIERLRDIRNDLGLLCDFALMAQAVEVLNCDWTVVFPKGGKRCLQFCEDRKGPLLVALSEYVGINKLRHLSFALQSN